MIRALALTLCLAPAATAQDATRVITLGGSVTEIAVALGAEGRIIARDTTSIWPESVQSLPDVGYIRALSPENVLALDPGLIVAEGDAGPPEAIDVLESAGIPFVLVPEATDPAGIAAKITAVATALDLPAEGAVLAARVEAQLAETQARAAAVETPRRVLFVLSLKGGGVMAGGTGTEAEGIIRLAGGVNAATGVQGYKPMTDEAVLAAAPDAILMMDREGDLSIADADILAQPALSQTPAAATATIIRMDGNLLLGFGPRTPEAADALHRALYGTEG
ncbi:MAG: ABC transporter substrate-binding protein [Rhodobacterales bacterium]|nr:ABC transporter substrate-binding protein [Rhodobacterales bacterium]